MYVAAAKGNYAGILMSLALLHQFAGVAAVPKLLTLAGWIVDPVDTAKAVYLLNAISLGQQVLGDMSSKVDWDMLLWPLMGVEAPGLDNIVQIMGDITATRSQLGAVGYAIMLEPERLIGSKFVDTNLEAQKGLRNLLNSLSMFVPMLGPVPTQALSAFAYNLPGFMHNEFELNVPRPGLGNQAAPLKPNEVRRYPGANMDSLRAMFRLRPGADVTNYKTAQQGKKMARETLTPEDNKALNDMQRTSGILGD
jgi:hypothetical protein